MAYPRQGILRGPTGGAGLAENELHRQQVIGASDQAGNETQDVICSSEG